MIKEELVKMKAHCVITRIVVGLFTVIGCGQWLLTTAEVVLWNVTSDADEVCMLMKMEVDVSHPVYTAISTVPAKAALTSRSQLESCPEEYAVFELSWTDERFNWTLGLDFNATDSTYALTRIYGTVVNKSGSARRKWSYREHSFPSGVSTSHATVCDYLKTLRGTFVNIKWQPFAQNTEGDFGPGEECQKKRISAEQVTTILIVAAIAILVTLVVAVFVQARGR